MLPIPSPLTCLSVALRRSEGQPVSPCYALPHGDVLAPGFPWPPLASPPPAWAMEGNPAMRSRISGARFLWSRFSLLSSPFSLISYYFFVITSFFFQ